MIDYRLSQHLKVDENRHAVKLSIIISEQYNQQSATEQTVEPCLDRYPDSLGAQLGEEYTYRVCSG